LKSIIRIGNAGGYWGDDLSALKRQLQGGQLDYITMDFLAEITMSIMQKQRATNPDLGYATDFIDQLQECLPIIVEKNVRVITNAGGINPLGLGQRIVGLATKMGLKIKVGVVSGDDILSGIDHLVSLGENFTNMETGEKFDDIRTRVTSANIYFGAAPVVKALDAGCQIVVTGRVTDTGITLAPMIHEFKWSATDWDKLAAGIGRQYLRLARCKDLPQYRLPDCRDRTERRIHRYQTSQHRRSRLRKDGQRTTGV
jgi:hypothetical protein